ncbi:MAG: DUF3332 family protein [candidate division NC10 bacterium]
MKGLGCQAAAGCYGGFTLTKALYKFNGEIRVNGDQQTNRVAQSVVMVILVIVPVYQLAALADAVIVNSIEFWTGKNPMTAGLEPEMRTVYRGGERYVQTFIRTASGKEMRIEYYREGRHVNTLVIHHQENSPTVTANLHWSEGHHEVYQVTVTEEDNYLIGHTDATGAQRQWSASSTQVAKVSSQVWTFLASPVAVATGLPAPPTQ